MALPAQTSRGELIRKFRALGWEGPSTLGKSSPHQKMRKGTQRQPIPNPHRGDVPRHLLKDILRKAGISDDEWNEA